jgi:DNA repair ATPase RecN
MIEGLELRNFQSHKNTEIVFTEGLNVIIGSSDSGKSSVLRAFGLVVKNKPSGEGMISHWVKEDGKVKGEMEIGLVVDGKKVVRRRSSVKNEYELDGEIYKGMGSDVPRPVADLMNLDDVNIQEQHDSVFLLSDSAGEIAKKLNRVVNLDKMDIAISNIEKWRRRKVADKKLRQERLDGLEVQISELLWIGKAEEEINEYENLCGLFDDKREKKVKIQEVIDQLDVIDLDQFSWVDDAQVDLDELRKMNEKANDLVEKTLQVRQVVDEIESIHIKDFDFDGLLSMMEELQDLEKRKDDCKKKVFDIEGVLVDLRTCSRNIKKTENNIMYDEDLFHREMPDICPLCQSDLRDRK